MFTNNPIPAIDATKAEPPYDMNGRGIPVSGTRATIAAKFNRVCAPSQLAIPAAKS